MSTNTTQRAIDRDIDTLMQELAQENTLIPETPLAKFQKAVKIYGGLKSLFAFLAKMPVIPPPWRNVIAVFIEAMDALTGVAGEISSHFKAGKDV